MKHLLRLFTATLLACGALQLSAANDDYNFLTFRMQSGDESSLSLTGLKLTFNNGVMTATQNQSQTNFQLEELAAMFFSKEATGLKSIAQQGERLAFDGQQLNLNGLAGTDLRVYDANGRLVRSQHIADENTQLNLQGLAKGIYIVKAGSETQKVLVK